MPLTKKLNAISKKALALLYKGYLWQKSVEHSRPTQSRRPFQFKMNLVEKNCAVTGNPQITQFQSARSQV